MKKFVSVFSITVLMAAFAAFAPFLGFAHFADFAHFVPCAQAKSNLVIVQPSQASQLDVQSDFIELVVDFSGSMNNWIRQSISALQSILPKIDSNTNVGLRVFGQYSGLKSMFVTGCTATEQVVSFGKNKNSILSALNSTQIGGATPLTYALRQTVSKDFAGISYQTKKKIILVTDGYESCGGNPCSYVRNLVQTRKDIVIDVILVGNSASLSCLADATGGNVYYANDVEAFRDAMAKSFDKAPEEVYQNYAPIEVDYDGEPILGY